MASREGQQEGDGVCRDAMDGSDTAEEVGRRESERLSGRRPAGVAAKR